MSYSPDGVNTQVLGPVSVASGEEADAMKARWKEELLKMKQGDTIKYSGGTYDIFRGTDEKGEYVYWGKYVFGGKTYSVGFQGNQDIVSGFLQSSLKQKLQALQISSSYENQYDEILSGYNYMTAMYASYVPNFPYIQRAPNIILQTPLETLMYNEIVRLQNQYSVSDSYDVRGDNLQARADLYKSINSFRFEKIRTLPDGAAKDAEVAQVRSISHELMQIAILQLQISAEMELGMEKITSIKNGTEIVTDFIPFVGTGVSAAVLFHESSSVSDRAWAFMGLIPYGKVGKYAGKIDDVIEITGGVMKKEKLVNSSLDSIFIF